MVRHSVGQIESAEPTDGQVRVHHLAEGSIQSHAEGVPKNQRSDHQPGIDRRHARGSLEGRNVPVHVPKAVEPADGSQQVIRRDVNLDKELAEQNVPRSVPIIACSTCLGRSRWGANEPLKHSCAITYRERVLGLGAATAGFEREADTILSLGFGCCPSTRVRVPRQ